MLLEYGTDEIDKNVLLICFCRLEKSFRINLGILILKTVW